MTDQQALAELRKLFGTSPSVRALVEQVANARVERMRKDMLGVYDPNILQRSLGRLEGIEEFINHITADSAETHRNPSPARN